MCSRNQKATILNELIQDSHLLKNLFITTPSLMHSWSNKQITCVGIYLLCGRSPWNMAHSHDTQSKPSSANPPGRSDMSSMTWFLRMRFPVMEHLPNHRFIPGKIATRLGWHKRRTGPTLNNNGSCWSVARCSSRGEDRQWDNILSRTQAAVFVSKPSSRVGASHFCGRKKNHF